MWYSGNEFVGKHTHPLIFEICSKSTFWRSKLFWRRLCALDFQFEPSWKKDIAVTHQATQAEVSQDRSGKVCSALDISKTNISPVCVFLRKVMLGECLSEQKWASGPVHTGRGGARGASHVTECKQNSVQTARIHSNMHKHLHHDVIMGISPSFLCRVTESAWQRILKLLMNLLLLRLSQNIHACMILRIKTIIHGTQEA